MNFGIVDFFNLFPRIFMITAFISILLLLIFFFSASGLRRPPKPVCYISYKKNYFHEDFEFTLNFVIQQYLQRMKSVQSVPVLLVKIKSIGLRNELCIKSIYDILKTKRMQFKRKWNT